MDQKFKARLGSVSQKGKDLRCQDTDSTKQQTQKKKSLTLISNLRGGASFLSLLRSFANVNHWIDALLLSGALLVSSSQTK